MSKRTWCVVAILVITAKLMPGAANGSELFDHHTVLPLSLTVDFDELCKPSEDPQCGFTSTSLRFEGPNGEDVTLPVEIRRRDGWRALHTNCQIPTLFMRFPQDLIEGTPFEGQTTLALTSHCGKGIAQGRTESPTLPSQFERYVINEYLGYRLYSLFTDASIGVRLARMTYVHPDQPRRSITHDAFFAEHFESLARRMNATLLEQGSYDPARIDPAAARQLAVFQYMIGNTDWSLEQQDNIILLRNEDGIDVPVLFDLDQSGLVNAHYAQPRSDLPIQGVKQRYFMGPCMSAEDLEQSAAQFSGMRNAVLSELAGTPGLGRGDRRMTGVYLDGFFDIIDSPAGHQAMIRTCRS